MRKYFQLLVLIAVTLVFESCCRNGDCDQNDDFPVLVAESRYEPIFMERSEFENSVALSSAQPIINAGKIYVYENYLFINEKNEGFHIFNNEDPSNPISIHFINSPGATDLSIRENVLFINQATDLIAVQIDLESGGLAVSKRIKETFPVMLSPDGFYPHSIPENNVVVNWTLKPNSP
ncbi:MAG: hypothetical protein CL526_09565 [Aequorivita sp.]|nr:hypothetical protein [Aequorivita sp.]|tara:strand:+ start:30629 stop:31162 length:534 start_codon:yes stop_codon:yes gene_type:complete